MEKKRRWDREQNGRRKPTFEKDMTEWAATVKAAAIHGAELCRAIETFIQMNSAELASSVELYSSDSVQKMGTERTAINN